MARKVLLIGGVAIAAVLAGSWAFAHPVGRGYGPGYGMGGYGMHGYGYGPGAGRYDRGGPGWQGHMGPGWRGHMGPGWSGGRDGGYGPGWMHRGPGFTQLDPARIDALKTELSITAAQEPAWTKYAQAVKDAATTIRSDREKIDRDAVAKMTPQERYDFRTQMRESHLKQFEAVRTAATELLATLDDTQKVKAQERLPGVAFGPGLARGPGAGPGYGMGGGQGFGPGMGRGFGPGGGYGPGWR